MNLLGLSERHSDHETTLGCYPEDETRIKDGKERLELNRGPNRGGHTGFDPYDSFTYAGQAYML